MPGTPLGVIGRPRCDLASVAWQYVGVRTPDGGVTSRRALLRGALAAAGVGLVGTASLSGCDLYRTGSASSGATPALDNLLADTVALGQRYDTTIAAVPGLAEMLTPLRDAHRAHAQALAAAIGATVPSPGSSQVSAPTDRQSALTALERAEKVAQAESLAACLAASPRLAPLLGSITAARASHREVLL